MTNQDLEIHYEPSTKTAQAVTAGQVLFEQVLSESNKQEIEDFADNVKIQCPGVPRDHVASALLSQAPLWPDPLAHDAFHGPLGELVHIIEPHTEADPAALLIQAIVLYGSVIGRHSYFLVEGSRHYLNLFALLYLPRVSLSDR